MQKKGGEGEVWPTALDLDDDRPAFRAGGGKNLGNEGRNVYLKKKKGAVGISVHVLTAIGRRKDPLCSPARNAHTLRVVDKRTSSFCEEVKDMAGDFQWEKRGVFSTSGTS